MTRGEAVNWLINISADIGKAEHRELWHYEQALSEIREMLESEPERKEGKWNTYYHGEESGRSMFTYSCNQCGYSAPYNLIGGVCEQKKWNFCPNCGARMEGRDETD